MSGGLPVQVHSAAEAIRPFRWRISLTYALTMIEDLLELSYPWATGLAINGLLAHDYRMAAPVMGCLGRLVLLVLLLIALAVGAVFMLLSGG